MDMAEQARLSVVVGALLPLIVAGCGPYHGTPPSRASVTGSVTYRERSALPPDAVVRVQLSDVSRQDAASHFPEGVALSREVWTVIQRWSR